MKYGYSSLRYGISPLLVCLSIFTSEIPGMAQATASEQLNVEDHSNEQIREAGSQLNSEHRAIQETANDPPTSIEEILKLPSLAKKEEAFAHVVAQLAEDDAFELLEKIKSISDSEQRLAFLRVILPRLTQLNLEQTLASFLDFSSADQFSTVESIYANVSIDDEIDAVRASNDFPTNLQEKALLALLSARDFTFSRVLEFAKVAPSLVVHVVSGLEGYTEQYEILGELIQHWVRIDLQQTIDLIKDLHATTLDDGFLRKSMTSAAAIYPAESLQFTHDYFRDFGSVLEANVYEAIVERDARVAKQLLPNVRRIYIGARFGYLGETLLKLGPEYAIEFGRSLPLNDSERFFRYLDNEICKVEPQVFIDALDDIQAVESVSKIAKCVLLEASLDDKLTFDQFEILYGKLLGKDLRSIDEYKKSNFIRGEAR